MSDLYANSGRMRTNQARVNLLEPNVEDIYYSDVVGAASRIPRFNGHGRGEITILEHMLRTYLIAKSEYGIGEPKLLRTILCHDLHEPFVGDMSSPMKTAMRMLSNRYVPSPFDILDDKWMFAIASKFDLFYPHPPEVRECDIHALAAECELQWGQDEPGEWGLDRVPRLFEMPMSRQRLIEEFRKAFQKTIVDGRLMYG